jgi:hypothetical protein
LTEGAHDVLNLDGPHAGRERGNDCLWRNADIWQNADVG